jgi:F-type H+-transporting ATPase subunit beta
MHKQDAFRKATNPADGIVDAVRGAVVDVVFAEEDLPQINSALIVEWDRPTPLILEVHSHLDMRTLRAVAFQSTAGLARGVAVRATGGSGRSACWRSGSWQASRCGGDHAGQRVCTA